MGILEIVLRSQMGTVNTLGVSCKHGGKNRVAEPQAAMVQAVREITKYLMESLFLIYFP